MYFKIVSEIKEIETIAEGHGIKNLRKEDYTGSMEKQNGEN